VTRRTLTAAVARDQAPAVVAVAATAWWLIEVTRSWAGRDAPSVTVGAILVALAVVLVRPDRVLPRSAVLLATAISIGAFVVPLSADTGWAGAPDAAIYACGAWLALVVAATIVSRPDTFVWFLTLVAASAAIQFMSGWLGWWGGEDPARPMVGTFYWHNPYAAFLIPGGLVGLAFWIWRVRLFALLGLLCFLFATVGIVYSTSRASLASFVLGVVLVGVLALVGEARWRALRQFAFGLVIAVAGSYFVGGPPFFPHRSSPLSGEQARAAGQSLSQNGGYRLDFWREALTVFRHHPVTGGGFKSMVAQSIGHVPKSWPLSPYAHNGYLQALGDGGLVLGVPFLLAVLVVAVVCVRSLIRGVIRRDLSVDAVVLAIALACVMLHAGVDFDWTYAADFAMASVLAGLVVGRWLIARQTPAEPAEPNPDKRAQSRRLVLGGCVLAGVALLGVSAWVMRDGNHGVNIRLATPSASQGDTDLGR
jgi:O-antigen ligase